MLQSQMVLWILLYPCVLLTIVVVDYFLGATAEYLNAYEIVRLTFRDSWPATSERYLLGQDTLGRAALAVGWLAYLVEGALVTGLLGTAWWGLRRVVC